MTRSRYYIAKLADDMISLAEQPRHVEVTGGIFGQNGPNRTDDKPFLHAHTQRGVKTYYLSWGAFFGMSESVYGPFRFVGTFISPALIAPDFRMPIDPEQPYPYKQLDYKDRHGSFMSMHGQWYFVCNDLSHSLDKQSPNSFRDTIIAYAHYYANGTIAPLVINGTGVGNYDGGAWIEAENFFRLVDKVGGAEKRQIGATAGFEVAGLRGGAELHFPNIAVSSEKTRMRLRGACADGALVEVRRLDAASSLLGRCALPAEAVGGEATCALGAPVTSAGIGLRFVGGEGGQGAGCSLDSFALW